MENPKRRTRTGWNRFGVLQSMGRKELDTAERLNLTEGLEALILTLQHSLWFRSMCATCTVSRVLTVTRRDV